MDNLSQIEQQEKRQIFRFIKDEIFADSSFFSTRLDMQIYLACFQIRLENKIHLKPPMFTN